MKRVLIYGCFLLAAFLLETTVFSGGTFLYATPNLILAISVAGGFLAGPRCGMFTGFAGGMLMDLSYGRFLGRYALILMAVGFLAGHLYGRYFEKRLVMPMLLTAGADILYGLYVYLTGFFLRGRLSLPSYFVRTILPEAAATVVFMIPVYLLLRVLEDRLLKEERKGRRAPWLKS